ncbi:MAG: hypothetical protein ACYC2H_10190 [Thermoplasmatota archaeon]
MSRPCPNKVGGRGAPCRLEMAHVGSCLPPRRPKMLVAAFAVVAVALAGCSSGPPNPCEAAAEWHSEQALYSADPEVSRWHQWKAEQFGDAATWGESDCADWMAYASPPADLGGEA